MTARAMPHVHPTIVRMLDETARAFGERAALVEGEITLTYGQLRGCSGGLARLLHSLVPAGARVATLLRNSLVAAVAPYAIAESGCVHVPLNPLYTARELGIILDDSRPALVLVDDALADEQQALLASLPGCRVVLAGEVAARLPEWAARPDGPALGVAVDPAAIALVQYTGGSTGRPKGVQLTHRAINTNVAQREALLPVARGRETVLCVMPLFHSYAMAMGLFLSAYSGSTMVILPGYHPERLLEAIGRHQVTIFPGSPTIFVGLLGCEQFAATDWSRVHTCYSGSAPLPAQRCSAGRPPPAPRCMKATARPKRALC